MISVRFSEKINRYFLNGHERTRRVKKNIVFSFVIKGLSTLISLLIIPLSIKYINSTQYGIWLTLSSIVSWMTFFDLGLGNGLRNKLAEANALKKSDLPRTLVSTTYALLAIISLAFFLCFLLFNHFANWNTILNTGTSSYNFNRLAILVFGLFCLQFVVQTINTVLTACHLIFKVSLIVLISQILVFIAIYFLIRFTSSSLFLLVLVNGAAPILIQLTASLWYYRSDLRYLAPGLRFINFGYSKELLSLGGVFFIIQIGALVLFQTDNIVVAQLFGPAQVTTFNVAYKLFSVFIFGFNVIISPFWSEFTDAYAKKDFPWIRLIMVKMRYVWVFTSLGTVVLLLLASYIYPLWLNHSAVTVPVSLSLAMTFYVIVYVWQTTHVYLLNGISKIRLQLYLVVFCSLINIPLAIFLAHKIGLAGVTWSNSILFLLMGVIFSYQTKQILNSSAKGILDA